MITSVMITALLVLRLCTQVYVKTSLSLIAGGRNDGLSSGYLPDIDQDASHDGSGYTV